MGALTALLLVHAHLVASIPAAGDTVRETPAVLRLEFSEPVEHALSRIRILGPDGSEIELEVRADPADVRALLASPPLLASGGYRVVWRIVSTDGHPVAGDFAFYVLLSAVPDTTLLAPPPPVPEASRSVVGVVAARWATLSALLALAGLLAFAPSDRMVLALALAAPFLLAVQLAAWAVYAAPDAGLAEAIGLALGTGSGRLDALRIVLAALALWAVGLARRPRLALAFAMAAVLTGAALGHALGTVPIVSIPAKGLHLVAAALWLGGLLAIARAGAGGPDPALARRVSSVALAAVVAIAVTGVLQALVLLPDLGALFGSTYGRVLLAKVAGLALLAGFGAHHRGRLLPRLADASTGRRLHGSVRREVAVFLAVAAVAAALAHIPPPGLPPSLPPAEPSSTRRDLP